MLYGKRMKFDEQRTVSGMKIADSGNWLEFEEVKKFAVLFMSGE